MYSRLPALDDAAVVSTTVPVAAQTPVDAIARSAGQAHAIARVCGDYSDEQLRDMKRDHKAASAQAGLTPANFETLFQSGYAETRAKLATQTPAEKEADCRKMKSMLDGQ